MVTTTVKTGVLFKKGSGIGLFSRKNWKPRYFELSSSHLSYYDEQGGKLKGALHLASLAAHDIEIMPCDGRKTGKSASTNWRICLNTNGRRFFIAAATEDEMYEWVQALLFVIATCKMHKMQTCASGLSSQIHPLHERASHAKTAPTAGALY
ncbi:hypothetical protein SPRG_13267 [Saprolegnia parasitica CBS 223.65]|uniref:PH domain-containing protein n=1 Tax=Saprolegnia parasitica (strain CBS 223.65) TaxID=695850 RepID=A0A067BTJ8_SAPPC|nr:hypothetical protein SPRG_13267 [Saprolegnia parasitica CBS 223.65]KDO21583.1 hypothetical protein SPRG_13267 [Saprolegnia parasitica CBS 223.65]|eukprot:XP_012207674.1 hypothetical protein SPRG_13267 [Saprolegnia parasitica CBS 223.65]